MADFESKAFQPCKEWIAAKLNESKSWDEIKGLCVDAASFDDALQCLIDEESWPLKLDKKTWQKGGRPAVQKRRESSGG